MAPLIFILLAAVPFVAPFPWMADIPGVDMRLLGKRSPQTSDTTDPGSEAKCPNNPNHPGAAPFNRKFAYTNAQDGLPGNGTGGFEVPIDGDTAHNFEAPGPLDIRGPCPGLNTAANHHFLSHDGITTYTELLDAQQNVYNVGYDLAVTLAVLGVGLTGDPTTEKMSIGCDASSRTEPPPPIGSTLSQEGGLDSHNKFEQDTSLSRSDYFLREPNDFSFNATLFGMMAKTTNDNFDLPNMVKYMSQRYAQSIAENPNFYFGPKSVLLYGAASFLFELFPSLGIQGPPNLFFTSAFFGATALGNGKFEFNNREHIPDDWKNRRVPMTNLDVANDFIKMYGMHPVLLGGNVGVNNFDAMGDFGTGVNGGPIIKGGKIVTTNPNDIVCLLYQLATEDVPDSLNTVLTLPEGVLKWTTKKLNPVFKGTGCPLKLN